MLEDGDLSGSAVVMDSKGHLNTTLWFYKAPMLKGIPDIKDCRILVMLKWVAGPLAEGRANSDS